MLLFFRTTTFVGVCVEFVAAVAWLAELFPDPKRREAVLGYTQAFSSLGGLDGDRRLLRRGALRSDASGHSRRPRSLALHPHLRDHPRDSAHRDSSVPSRISEVAREERGGDAQTPERRRDLPARAPKDDPRDRAHVRLQLRGRVRRHPAPSPDRSRSSRGPGASRGPQSRRW